MKYGRNTAEVERFIDLLPTLTWEQWKKADWPGLDLESERALWDLIEFAKLSAEANLAHTAVHSAARAAIERAYIAANPATAGEDGRRGWQVQGENVKRIAWPIAHNASRYVGQCIVVGDALPAWRFASLTTGLRDAGIDFDALRQANR